MESQETKTLKDELTKLYDAREELYGEVDEAYSNYFQAASTRAPSDYVHLLLKELATKWVKVNEQLKAMEAEVSKLEIKVAKAELADIKRDNDEKRAQEEITALIEISQENLDELNAANDEFEEQLSALREELDSEIARITGQILAIEADQRNNLAEQSQIEEWIAILKKGLK